LLWLDANMPRAPFCFSFFVGLRDTAASRRRSSARRARTGLLVLTTTLLLTGCGARTGFEDAALEAEMGDAGPPQGDAAQGVPAPSILLFGGIAETADGGYTEVNDTWVWTAPAGWTEVHPAQPPSARYGAMGASLGGDVVLFGGDGPVAETWS
jgi:hypothetical protein